MGKPRMGEASTARLVVPCTPDEYAGYAAQAERLGMALAAYVRAVLNGVIKVEGKKP